MKAHARRDDPGTSHEAADALTDSLRQLQARVADYAKRAGPRGFTDAEMSEALADGGSTYRTRRAELAARNIILDSGYRRTHGASGRARIVWRHRDHVANPPPVIDAPDAPASKADRDEAISLAASLIGIADGFRRQGFGAAAETIARGARLLKKLAA